MSVVLIGYRGTGKSTVASLLAEKLGWDSIDADLYLETQAGRSIREIFELEGESGFREREAAAIGELTARERIVLAAGGGAVLRVENRRAFRRAGLTVWLTASADSIEQRLARDPSSVNRRPALTGLGSAEEIRHLLVEREPLYRECADFIVNTDNRTPGEIVELILNHLRTTRAATETE